MASSHNYLAFNRKGPNARLPFFFFQVPSIMDEKISDLFQEWLSAFGAVQVASGEEAIARAHSRLSEIETQIANTPGEGMQCLAIKLGLHCFLNDHADAASLQSESAYRDLVRLSGHDPAAEIFARFGETQPAK
jgi:hypothetical protein